MSQYAQFVNRRQTPQSEPIPGRPGMVPNAAGGYVFALDDWARLDRFLVLGADSATYYASARDLTRANAACVERCLAADADRAVARIVAISDAGRAPRNDPAIFALALATVGHLDAVARHDALNKVCRTGGHLIQFVQCVKPLRGFGAGLRRLIAGWYRSRPADEVAFQAAKYRSRGGATAGWSHRDILRRVGGTLGDADAAHSALYRWICRGMEGLGQITKDRRGQVREYAGHDPADLPAIIGLFEAVKAATTKAEVLALLRAHRVPREFLEGSHSALLNDPEIWDALLQQGMPLTALVRNLGKLSAVGLLKPLSAAVPLVADRLADRDYIRKSRLHPLALLTALKVYASGRGLKGSNTWVPVPQVVDALDAAFYAAFDNVVPAGKRTLIGLDVSGSMAYGTIAGSPLSPREAAAALLMVTARTEPAYHILAFATRPIELQVTARARLQDVVRETGNIPMGGTDCALPMLYASANKLDVDTFMVLTDNETWAGSIHPCQALVQYRQRSGIAAKLAVVGMTATGTTIGDPQDAGVLDVVGFDTATPALIADFSRGFDAPAAVVAPSDD